MASQDENHYGPCSDTVDRLMMNTPDVLVRNCGSMWAFNPLTDAAKTFFDKNVASEPWQWLGSSLAVQHRYAADLAAGMHAAGLVLA